MLSAHNFKNNSSIRRKAYNRDNLVQAAGAARGKRTSPLPPNFEGVQPATGLRRMDDSRYPELRFACKGLSTFIAFGDGVSCTSSQRRGVPHFRLHQQINRDNW